MSEPTVDPAKPQSFDLADTIPLATAIAKLTPGTTDDRIVGVVGGLPSNPATGGIFNLLLGLLNGLIHRHSEATKPAPGVVSVPVTTPAANAPAAVPAPPPVATPLTATAAGDIATLKGKLSFIELPPRITGLPRGVSSPEQPNIESHARFDEIQQGANIHCDSWLHCDVDPIGDDGAKYETGDPRWASANHWAPNGNPIWLYYEWNGQSTLDGHHSEFVEPGSVEDDLGCTPTYKITGPGKFRFGFQYKRHDGKLVDSGLIGQGGAGSHGAVGGAPFNISQG